MRKWLAQIVDFFIVDDVETVLHKDFSETDTQDIETGEFKLEEVIDYTQYWWNYEGKELEKVPCLIPSTEECSVVNQINDKIINNKLPLIEIPKNILKIITILNNPDFNYYEVIDLINHSPGVAGDFVSLANSALYNRGHMISDLPSALPRLGKDNVKAMLYMHSSKESFPDGNIFNQIAEKIINHSYTTAIVAGYLSQRFFPNPDMAFLAGLMHNIGKLGILRALPEVCEIPKDFSATLTEESFDNIFPDLYEKAGAFLATNWDLDDVVISAILHHNDFFKVGMEDELSLHLSSLINMASTMTRILGQGRTIEEATDIFALPATVELNIERDTTTIQFLEDIPNIIDYKTKEEK